MKCEALQADPKWAFELTQKLAKSEIMGNCFSDLIGLRKCLRELNLTRCWKREEILKLKMTFETKFNEQFHRKKAINSLEQELFTMHSFSFKYILFVDNQYEDLIMQQLNQELEARLKALDCLESAQKELLLAQEALSKAIGAHRDLLNSLC